MPATKQKKKKPTSASNKAGQTSMPKKTNGRGRPKGSKADKTKKAKQSNYKKQMWAIALFAIGVLVFFLTLIKGEYLWNDLRNIMFGLFSVISFVIAPMIIYTAVMLSLERPFGSISGKLIQGFVLVVLLCSLIHIIINGKIEGTNFFDQLINLFKDSVNFKSGGLVVALIGWPLMTFFGEIPAAIIISVLIFVFALLLSGITLSGFFSLFSKPAKKIEQAYVSQLEARQENKLKSRFNIDVDIDSDTEPEPMPSHPVQVLTTDQSSTSNDTKVKIDDIIKAFSPEDGKKQNETDPSDSGKSEDSSGLSDKTNQAEEKQPKQPSNPDAPIFEPVKTESGIYRFPPLSLLKRAKQENNINVSRELEENAKKLVATLKSFGVSATVTDITRGPTVTRYELQPSAGVKISKITGLSDDIALNLAAAGVRIEAPIPNKAAIGIEVPNRVTSMVNISEILSSDTFKHAKSKLTIALGKDISGNIAVADINKMPHALIAGATGSGKSVCINTIIMSLLYKSSPNDVRLLLIDPKVVELSVYNGIPHLLVPVVTDPRKAAGALSWAVSEMLNRYKLFAEKNVRDLNGYNRLAKQTEDMNYLPQIVIIIDELADLMMAAPNEVEDSVCRLAQMARAAGMHLVIATQRPSVDVITGVIKANIPTRIAFAVSSQIDSRTILDGSGAEKLLGKGDMLFNPVGESKPVRIQGCFISDTEVESVISYINDTQSADYDETIMEEIEKMKVQEKGKKIDTNNGDESDDSDPMLYKAIECVVELGQASTSLLQRKLKLGYARAARIVDMMEDRGVVGPFEGSKPRKVLISKQQLIEMTMNNDTD